MRYCPIVLSAIFAMTTFLKAEEGPPFRCVVEEFAPEKHRQFTPDATSGGFFLSDVLLMPSREWIVFVVESSDASSNMAKPAVVGCYHLASGRKRQLVFSSLPQQSESQVVIELVPLEANHCGVVVGVSSPLAVDASNRKDQAGTLPTVKDGQAPSALRWRRFLWEWDLVTDGVRFRGPWEGAMNDIASLIKLEQCEVCWMPIPNVNLKGELKVRRPLFRQRDRHPLETRHWESRL